MAGDRILRGMLAAWLGAALTACGPQLPPPVATEIAPWATSAPTASATAMPALTPLEPPTATPGLPTPVAGLPGRLETGVDVVVHWIQMSDPDSGWAVARVADGFDRIVRTRDAGRTWADVTPPEWIGTPADPRRATIAAFADGRQAWVVYSGAMDLERGPIAVAVWRTTDGGATWKPSTLVEAPEGSGWFQPLSLGVLEDGFGWLMAAVDAGMMHQYIALYTTQDAGATWTRVLDPYAEQPVQSCPKTGLVFADSLNGWMSRDCSGLMDQVTLITTTDGGVTWTERSLPAPPGLPEGFAYPHLCRPHSLLLEDSQSGSLAVSCEAYLDTPSPAGEFKRDGPDGFYRTEDGGATWTVRAYPGGGLLWLDTSSGWALGRDLYQTRDHGESWQFIRSVSWDGQFTFVDPRNGWAVARQGEEIALVRTQNGGATWSLLRPVIGP